MTIKTWVKGKWEEHKKESAYKNAAEKRIAQREREEYYKAKEEESTVFAKHKAKYEREERIKQMKSKRSSGLGGLFGSAPSSSKVKSPNLSALLMGSGSNTPSIFSGRKTKKKSFNVNTELKRMI